MIAIQITEYNSKQIVYFPKKLNSFIVYSFNKKNNFLCKIKNYNNQTKNEWIEYSKYILYDNNIIKVYL